MVTGDFRGPAGCERQMASSSEVVRVAVRAAHLPGADGERQPAYRACEIGENRMNHAWPTVIIGRMATTVRAWRSLPDQPTANWRSDGEVV